MGSLTPRNHDSRDNDIPLVLNDAGVMVARRDFERGGEGLF